MTDKLLARLDLLAEAGMDLVEDLRVRTLARTAAMIARPEIVEAAEPERDVGLMFDRLSRAIRLTTMMQVSLATERRNREALDKAAAATAPAEETKRAATAEHAQKVRKKAEAKRILDEEIIEREERDPRDAADLREDLETRFERNDEFADILHLPLGEIVARISWLLGLDPDWTRWKFELWAPDAARAKRPDMPRPYRAFGYPVLPLIYIAMAVFIEVQLLRYKPQYTWPGLIIVILGVPVYWIWKWRAGSGAGQVREPTA